METIVKSKNASVSLWVWVLWVKWWRISFESGKSIACKGMEETEQKIHTLCLLFGGSKEVLFHNSSFDQFCYFQWICCSITFWNQLFIDRHWTFNHHLSYLSSQPNQRQNLYWNFTKYWKLEETDAIKIYHGCHLLILSLMILPNCHQQSQFLPLTANPQVICWLILTAPSYKINSKLILLSFQSIFLAPWIVTKTIKDTKRIKILSFEPRPPLSV